MVKKVDNIMVTVRGLRKSFNLPDEQHSGVKQAIVGAFSTKHAHRFKEQKVLRGINFEIKKGEFFGIVGRNGSGKSTLLKLLAGIYVPDGGSVALQGSLTPFIELGVGFNPELTGRENVYLNGALLGFSHVEVEEMYDAIVDFAELEGFMDQKLKNYSSGMQVRLAFSVAIRSKSDILLIDEVLAVGDSAFQQKCYDTFFELKRKGVTIILVTHDMGAVLKFCDRALMLNKGEVEAIGKPYDVSEAYLEENYSSIKANSVDPLENEIDSTLPYINEARIEGVGDAKNKEVYDTGDKIEIHAKTPNVTEPIAFGFQIFNQDGVYCFGTNTLVDRTDVSKGTQSLTIRAKLDLLPGTYFVTLATMNRSATKTINYHSRILTFRIRRLQDVQGVASITRTWEINKKD